MRRNKADASVVEVPRGYNASVRWLPRIGDIFPNFTAETTQGRISFHDWAEGQWVTLFSHPGAFTPICTTELASLAQAQQEFTDRGVRLLGLSRSTADDQLRWASDIEQMFDVKVRFPVIDDSLGALAATFGMIHPKEGADWTIRKTFIIDPSLKVRMIFEYPVYIGRSTEETLRVIDALQVQDAHTVGTPADWNPGNSCLLPFDMTDAAATQKYGSRWTKLSDYLRTINVEHRVE